MKKNRISGLLFLLVILAVIGYSAHEMVNQGKDEDYISVSVVVNDSSNVRWDAFVPVWSREQKIIMYI